MTTEEEENMRLKTKKIKHKLEIVTPGNNSTSPKGVPLYLKRKYPKGLSSEAHS